MSQDIERELERILSEPASSVAARERHTLDRVLEESNGRVVLFGAGGLGTHALACLREQGTEPLAFSDNNRSLWGSRVGGLDVLPPDEAAARFGADALFIVTIWNPYHWYVETRRQLETLQCRRVVPASPVYWRFPEQFLPFYAQDLPHKVLAQADEVVAAAAIWSDDRSRHEYLQQVAWRVNGSWTFTPPSDRESYFLPDVFKLRADEVFVDCGAFDGDTLRAYLSHQPAFRQFVAIEPDETTYSKLSVYVSGLSPDIRDRITALHCAVGAERTLIPFQADGNLSSRISRGVPAIGGPVPADRGTGALQAGHVHQDGYRRGGARCAAGRPAGSSNGTARSSRFASITRRAISGRSLC